MYGKATDDSVDSDDQIIDATFARKGLQDWLRTGGNVRVMHSVNLYPAGVGVEVEDKDDGQYVKAEVVEPTAQRLVRKGVLRAFSVGISRPKIIRDRTARGGRVIDGVFSEISLVDRPANANCKLSVCKRASDGAAEWLNELEGDQGFITKAAKEGSTDADINAIDDMMSGEDHDKDDISAISEDKGDGDADGDDDFSPSAGPNGKAGPVDKVQWGDEPPKGHDNSDNFDDDDDDDDDKKDDKKAIEADLTKAPPPPPNKSSDTEDKPQVHPDNQGQQAPQGNSGGGDDNGSNGDHISGQFTGTISGEVSGGNENPAPDQGGGAQQQAQPQAQTPADGGGHCPTCDGGGSVRGKNLPCPTCHGSGAHPDTGQNDSKPAGPPGAAGSGQAPQFQRGVEADLWKAEADPDCKTCGGEGAIREGHVRCPECVQKVGGNYEERTMSPETHDFRAGSPITAEQFTRGPITAGHASYRPGDGPTGQPPVVDEATKAAAAARWAADIAKARGIPVEEAAEVVGDEVRAGSMIPGLDKLLAEVKEAVSDSTTTEGEFVATESVSYAAKRLHDALCPCYSWEDVCYEYPALAKAEIRGAVRDARDTLYRLMMEAATSETPDPESIATLAAKYNEASKLLDIEGEMLTDAREALNKEFSKEFMVEGGADGPKPPTPGEPPQPGQFRRGFLSAGHYREEASGTHQEFPNAAHTPEASDFHRDIITEGHEDDSPANKDESVDVEKAGREGVPLAGSPATAVFGDAARNAVASAMVALHDTFVSPYPQLCNLEAPVALASSSTKVLDMQTSSKPQPVTMAETQAHESKSMDPVLTKAAARDLLSEELAEYEAKIAKLEAEVEELASAPSLAQAPFRGVVAVNRALSKRAAEADTSAVASKDDAEIQLLQRYITSGNPELRTRAEERLAKLQK